MITWLLRRMNRKDRIATYIAALPQNGKRDDEIGELVHTAYGGKKHIHGNPKTKAVSDNLDSMERVARDEITGRKLMDAQDQMAEMMFKDNFNHEEYYERKYGRAKK